MGHLTVAAGGEGVFFGVHEGFGGHVVRGADLGVAVDVDGHVGLDGVGDAEVDDFEAALGEDEVGGFEIGVDDVFFVDGLHAFDHFFPPVSDEDGVETAVFGKAAAHEGVEV